MEIKSFYKSQLELAIAISELLDSYYQNIISENVLVESINKIVDNNFSKIIKGSEFTTVLQQKCGKRRLGVVARILKLSGKADLI